MAGVFILDAAVQLDPAPVTDMGSSIGADFILKALGYGAMGVTAIVLCLSYLLVRQLATASPPANDQTLQLVQRYMRFGLICMGAMVLLQVGEQLVGMYKDERLAGLERRVLTAANLSSVSEWNWEWGRGGWASKGTFIKRPDGKYDFAATTMLERYGAEPIRMIEWMSSEPVDVRDDGSPIVFLGKRRVVGPQDLLDRAYAGPTNAEYSTRFTLQPTWALVGKYSGPNGEGPFGGLQFTAAR